MMAAHLPAQIVRARVPKTGKAAAARANRGLAAGAWDLPRVG